jgi:hypothetical protein
LIKVWLEGDKRCVEKWMNPVFNPHKRTVLEQYAYQDTHPQYSLETCECVMPCVPEAQFLGYQLIKPSGSDGELEKKQEYWYT